MKIKARELLEHKLPATAEAVEAFAKKCLLVQGIPRKAIERRQGSRFAVLRQDLPWTMVDILVPREVASEIHLRVWELRNNYRKDELDKRPEETNEDFNRRREEALRDSPSMKAIIKDKRGWTIFAGTIHNCTPGGQDDWRARDGRDFSGKEYNLRLSFGCKEDIAVYVAILKEELARGRPDNLIAL